jgi:hypothetical protein
LKCLHLFHSEAFDFYACIHVGDIKAEEMVGDDVAKEVDGVVYCGKVASYSKTSQLWTVKYDTDEDELALVELYSAKQLYDASINTGSDDNGDVGDNGDGDATPAATVE